MRANSDAQAGQIVCDAICWPWQLPFEKNQLKSILGAMAQSAGISGRRVQLRLVNDAEMGRLNAAFAGCRGPTNVLTFPCQSEDGGSIAIALDSLLREALIYGQSGEEHFLRLLAHGFGHLGDYEHGEELDRIQAACLKAGLERAGQERLNARLSAREGTRSR